MEFQTGSLDYQTTHMDYKSTIQALFTLAVMIIVLLFMLFICCWRSLTLTGHLQRQPPSEENIPSGITRTSQHINSLQSNSGSSTGSDSATPRMLIVPYGNMIYLRDSQDGLTFQMALEREKPPPYTEINTYHNLSPPPPYSEPTNVTHIPQIPPVEQPPDYEEYFLEQEQFDPNNNINTDVPGTTNLSRRTENLPQYTNLNELHQYNIMGNSPVLAEMQHHSQLMNNEIHGMSNTLRSTRAPEYGLDRESTSMPENSDNSNISYDDTSSVANEIIINHI